MSWVFILQCTVSNVCWVVILDLVTLTPCSGVSSGCIAQHAVERQTRSRQGELLDSFYSPIDSDQGNVYSSDARGRASLPDCSVSCPISCASLPSFRFILCSRWDGNGISG